MYNCHRPLWQFLPFCLLLTPYRQFTPWAINGDRSTPKPSSIKRLLSTVNSYSVCRISPYLPSPHSRRIMPIVEFVRWIVTEEYLTDLHSRMKTILTYIQDADGCIR